MLDIYEVDNIGAAFDKMWGAAFMLIFIAALINIPTRFVSAKFSAKDS